MDFSALETEELVCGYQDGHSNAREMAAQVCTRLAPLIGSLVQKIRQTSKVADFDDRVQAGYMGVLRALQLWDRTRGCRFTTYAWIWIRREIFRVTEGPIRPRTTSVDYSDGPEPESSDAGPEASAEANELLEYIETIKPEKLRTVIKMRCLEGLSVEEISVRMGLSETRIYQYLENAARKLLTPRKIRVCA